MDHPLTLEATAPYHASSNQVENFMRPLDKAMKIGNGSNESESKILKHSLRSHC